MAFSQTDKNAPDFGGFCRQENRKSADVIYARQWRFVLHCLPPPSSFQAAAKDACNFDELSRIFREILVCIDIFVTVLDRAESYPKIRRQKHKDCEKT